VNDALSPDVYGRLGVCEIVNAAGCKTRLGGSRWTPEVATAVAEASARFVDLDELLEKSGSYVARLIGVEAAYITSGAAAGLVLATAACVAGDNPGRICRLPDTRGMPDRVAVHRSHRNGFDQAVRQVGVEFAEFGYANATWAWQLEAVLDDRVAAVLYCVNLSLQGTSLPLDEVVEISHSHRLPVIVDAAAELPPVSNLHYFNDLGADLVVFSGGKDIQGPQSSGLILGRQDLIRKCALNGCPNYSIGRPMKVCKEEIVGLVVALESYLARDWDASAARWGEVVCRWVTELGGLPGVDAWRVFPMPVPPGLSPVTIPRAYVAWDASTIPLTVEQASGELYAGNPRVAVNVDRGRNALILTPETVGPGEDSVVTQRIASLLDAHRVAVRPGS
jgi:uncharacterized pyridoxal phosphate-dependent enzyme